MPTGSQLSEFGVLLARGGNSEAHNVNEGRDQGADHQIGRDNLQVVVPQESPDDEIRSVQVCANTAAREN